MIPRVRPNARDVRKDGGDKDSCTDRSLEDHRTAGDADPCVWTSGRRSYVAVTAPLCTSTPFTRMETVHTPGVDDSCLFHNQ